MLLYMCFSLTHIYIYEVYIIYNNLRGVYKFYFLFFKYIVMQHLNKEVEEQLLKRPHVRMEN